MATKKKDTVEETSNPPQVPEVTVNNLVVWYGTNGHPNPALVQDVRENGVLLVKVNPDSDSYWFSECSYSDSPAPGYWGLAQEVEE